MTTSFLLLVLYLSLTSIIAGRARGSYALEKYKYGTELYKDNTDDLLEFIKNSTIEYLKKNKLNYGDSCNYSISQQRQKFHGDIFESIKSVHPSTSTEKITGDLRRYMGSLAKLPGTLCTASKFLECNLDGVCACDKNLDRFGVTLVYDRQANACYLAEGSTCFPQDLFMNNNPLLDVLPEEEAHCVGTTTCLFKFTQEKCTVIKILAEKERILKSLTDDELTNPAYFMMQKIQKGEICACGGTLALVPSILVLILGIFLKLYHS